MTERKQLLDFLLQLLPDKFEILLTRLDVAREFQPSSYNDHATRVSAFFQWVENEQGCGLDGLICELEELKWWKRPEKPVEAGVFMIPEGTDRFFGHGEQPKESVHDEIASPVALDVLTEDEAAQFLLRKTEQSDATAARALAREMDGLPLALDLAATYIREMKSSLAEYLELYRAEGRELRKRRGTNVSGHESVATTFGLAFRQIETDNPATADILRVCALCNPDEIPEELFLDSGDAFGESIAAVNGSPSTWLTALQPATRFSLLERDPANGMLALHRVVQDVIKDEMEEDARRQWAERFIVGFDEVFPAVELENWPICNRLISQAFAAYTAIEHFNIETETSAFLLNQAGFFLNGQARYAEAEPLYRRALRIRERVFGAEHPDTAVSLNNLAGLYELQGRYAEAETLYERALGIWERVLGAEHPDTAVSLNNLAGLYDSQSRYAEAEPLYERALGIRERTFGSEHPDTANSLNNLAALYELQDRCAEAEPLYERALGIRERTLGAEHPDTATSLNNLAALYELQDRCAEAEPLYERALRIRERTLGAEHPDTAQSLNNLAFLYKSQGRYREAESLYERAVGICQKALGDQHPHTKLVAENLEILRSKMSVEKTDG